MARAIVLASILTLSSCSGDRITPLPSTRAQPAAPANPDRANPARAPQPAGPLAAAWLRLEPADAVGAASAGAVAIARLGDRTLAFVADADDHAVVTFDVDSRQPLASTPIDARPSAVLVTTDGRVVALGADDARMHFLAMSRVDRPLVAEREIALPEEPVSAALVPSGNAILVASRWGHALSVVSLAGDVAPVVIDLPRDPAAVVASFDGRRAFVLHAVGSRASIVDLEARSVRTVSLDRKIQRRSTRLKPEMWDEEVFPLGWENSKQPSQAIRPDPRGARSESVTLHADQAFAVVRMQDRIVAPLVEVDTGPQARTSGYGESEAATTPAIVSFDDGGLAPPVGRRVFGQCLLPRGVGFDASSGRILVACLGNRQIAVLGAGPRGMKLQTVLSVPTGPVAVSIDERGRRAVVWSAFDREVSVVTIDHAPKDVEDAELPRTTPAPPDDALRGRVLFNANFDMSVSSDGRACASCHPDARDDGLAWSSPGGRRETPMLVDRLEDTAPYGWDGAAKDFARHMAHTTARLGGAGLSKDAVADIQAYVATLHAPAASRTGSDTLVARGAAIFHSDEAGCGGCHAGTALTDGDTHDVRSASRGDLRRAFDTPSLRHVARSAPYFHDGRYETLSDLLSGSDGTMGHTSQLSPADRTALEAYLERL